MNRRVVVPGPLVSVIVCTYNRPTMLSRALRSVLSQDFSDYEVIVVDDGSDKPVELVDIPDKRVRVLRTPHQGAGAARSTGLTAADGRLAAYCDDDDEWTPDHLSSLAGYLQRHRDVDLVYGDSRWEEGDSSSVPYSADHDPFILAGSNYIFASDVVHRTDSAREDGGFDASLTSHEDWDLWLRMSQRRVIRHLAVVVGIHNWHLGAVLAEPDWDTWAEVCSRHRRRTACEGIAPGFRDPPPSAGRVPFDHATWQGDRKELIWHSSLAHEGGFGTCARHLIRTVARQGVDIIMSPFGWQPARGFEEFYKPLDHWGRVGFYYAMQHQPSILRCERTVVYAMWESTRVPQEHIDEFNESASLVYVPCRQNVDAYRESGLRVPVKVLHHGVDAAAFPFIKRKPSDTFTFGTFGDLTMRKGIDLLLRAFRDEFAPSESVRLLVKTQGASSIAGADDPRITTVGGFADHRTLLDILRSIDALVMPSRGEGFGLCGLEAMSTGLPLIATNWGGPAEYLHPDHTFPLSYELTDARGTEIHGSRYHGLWAEPSYEHLRYLMREIYEAPAKARRKGQAASRWVHENWTWDRTARQMCDDLDEVAEQ